MNIEQYELLQKSAVAQRLTISERTLERLVHAGAFPPPLRLGKRALWLEATVTRWMQEQLRAQSEWSLDTQASKASQLPHGAGFRRESLALSASTS